MIDLCNVEEFFMSLPLKELNRCAQACKQWQQYLMKHPEVFWFKHSPKLRNYIRPCSCTFNQLFWCFNKGFIYSGPVIYPYNKGGRYEGDDIYLIGYNKFHF